MEIFPVVDLNGKKIGEVSFDDVILRKMEMAVKYTKQGFNLDYHYNNGRFESFTITHKPALPANKGLEPDLKPAASNSAA
jgi:hypothetical protein